MTRTQTRDRRTPLVVVHTLYVGQAYHEDNHTRMDTRSNSRNALITAHGNGHFILNRKIETTDLTDLTDFIRGKSSALIHFFSAPKIPSSRNRLLRYIRYIRR